MTATSRTGVVFLLVAGLFAAGAAQAQLQEPASIPANVSGQEQARLEQRRASLMTKLNTLRATIAQHNQRCSEVPNDSPLVEECRASQARLRAEVQEYRNGVAEYEAAVERLRAR